MKNLFTLVIILTINQVFSQCYSSISSKVFHNLAIKEDGTLWSWGQNESGQLGINSTINQSMPVQVGSDNTWAMISAGTYYSLALKADGTLWAWGQNTYGQTGNGGPIVPQMVGSENDWVYIAAGLSFSAAIKSDGSLWMWGGNFYGQLGNGTTNNSNTINQVGNDHDWVSVSLGSQHTLAKKSDGTIWAWGRNNEGQLGIGNTSNQYTPVQIGTDSNWDQLISGYSNSYAIKSNGTLWSWGSNLTGSVGNGATANQTSPLQIGNETWKSIATTYHCMAIKDDGTLWSWGRNNDGEVGNGTPGINQSTPIQVGTDNSWIKTSTGFYHSLGLKGNGTLWSWGDNEFGTLGNGSFTDNLVPSQTGTICETAICSIGAISLSDISAQCILEEGDVTSPSTTDSCGNVITGTLFNGNFPINTQGTTTLVWKFTNASGFVTFNQDVVLEDTEPPVPVQVSLPTLTAQCQLSEDEITMPQALDGCAGNITGITSVNFPITAQGTTIITWVFDDGNGNTFTQTQNIVIEDTISPTAITQDLTVDLAGANSVVITAEQIDMGSSDNCSFVILELDIETFTQTGLYPVQLSVSDAAGNVASAPANVTVIDSTMGTEDISKNQIYIYPIPVKDILYIKTVDSELIAIRIYDMTGRIMYENIGNNSEFDLTSLASSTYNLIIETVNGSFYKRIIK